jgi:glucose-6-phosphate isomerase
MISKIQNKNNIATYKKILVKKLKLIGSRNSKKRSRICIHKNNNEKTQEMIIALSNKSFIAPHIHPNGKSESYHVIEGKMNVYIFDKNGKKIKIVKMGDYKSNLDFFYRMSRGYYHMPIAVSKWCIYHEVYSGPFIKYKDVFYPKWAPNEDNKQDVKNFLKNINYFNEI